jgi:hypothetical protein
VYQNPWGSAIVSKRFSIRAGPKLGSIEDSGRATLGAFHVASRSAEELARWILAPAVIAEWHGIAVVTFGRKPHRTSADMQIAGGAALLGTLRADCGETEQFAEIRQRLFGGVGFSPGLLWVIALSCATNAIEEQS